MPSPSKKYICGYCARAFTRSEHKQRHERSHTNEKPFHCLYCTSAFVRRDLLQRHCRTVHNIRLVSRSKDKDDKHAAPLDPAASATESNGLLGQSESPGPVHAGQGPAQGPPLLPAAPIALPASPPLKFPAPPPLIAGPHHQLPPVVLLQPPPFAEDTHVVASAKALLQLAPDKAEPSPRPLRSSLPALKPIDVALAAAGPDQGPLDVKHNYQPFLGVGSIGSGGLAEDPLRRSSLLAPFSSLPPSLSSSLLTSFTHLDSPLAQDIFQLLHVAKSIELMCDAADRRLPLSDLFLVGFIALMDEHHLVEPTTKGDRLDYFGVLTNLGLPGDFKLGLVYTILSVGALASTGLDFDHEEAAITFANKAWTILVDKLIPNYSSLVHQTEILKNLFLLTYAHVRFFNKDLMLSYLEDSARIIFSNLTASADPACDDILHSHMCLFWNIYILVSRANANKAPPAFYSWFLSRVLSQDSDFTLLEIMRLFAKSSNTLRGSFLSEIVACTLSNEVNSITHNKVSWIFALQFDLLHAVVQINKSVEKVPSELMRPMLFEIFRKKALLDAPPKFKELLDSTVYEISESYHWQILYSAIREFDPFTCLELFISSNKNSLFQDMGKALLPHFNNEAVESLCVNYNFGISSFPLIFNLYLIELGQITPHASKRNANALDKAHADECVIHWYITSIKILIRLASVNSFTAIDQHTARNNVLQAFIYAVLEKEAPISSELLDVIMPMYERLTKICGLWLTFLDSLSEYTRFKDNLFTLSREVLKLAINNESLSPLDLHITSKSVSLKRQRSKSIGSFEQMNNRTQMFPSTPLGPSTSQLAFGYASQNSNPNGRNYILIGNGTAGSESMLPGAALPPIKSPGAMFQQTHSANGHNMMSLSASFQLQDSASLMLPPLQIEGSGQDKYSSLR